MTYSEKVRIPSSTRALHGTDGARRLVRRFLARVYTPHYRIFALPNHPIPWQRQVSTFTANGLGLCDYDPPVPSCCEREMEP